MNRFPPTLGVVGFDFGLKPAFSVAVVPGHGVRQQDDGDGVPDYRRCHDVLGDTLHYTTALVAACSGCYALPNSLGPDRDMRISLAGTNGTGTVTWNGTSAWLDAAGTVTITTFASSDLSCSGASFDTTSAATLVVTCLGDNQMGAGIIAGPITILGFTWAPLIFDAAARQPLGGAIANSLTAGVCGANLLSGVINCGRNGTIVVTP